MKNYNVVDYWNERGNPCSNTIDKLTALHLEYLERHTIGCENILDFGPGYGRMFPAYKYAKNVVGVDVTEQHKHKLYLAAKNGRFDLGV